MSVQPLRINIINRIIEDIPIKINITTGKADRIFLDEDPVVNPPA